MIKQYRYIIIKGFILLFLTLSCSNGSKDYIIPKKELIPIIEDIHLMSGMFIYRDIRNELAKNDSIDYYEALIREHGYTIDQFDSTITYYSKDLKKFDKIYQEVITRLSKKETELRELREAKKQMMIEKEKRNNKIKQMEKLREEFENWCIYKNDLY